MAVFERSRTFPVEPVAAYEAFVPLPLPALFARRYGPLPAIAEVRDAPVEAWGAAVGQSRTIVLADGSTMREQLTSVDPPTSFEYRITEVSGPMRLMADHIDGRWAFEPVGTGVRITWTWTIEPKSKPAAGLLRAFGKAWHGYATAALERLEPMLVAAASPRPET